MNTFLVRLVQSSRKDLTSGSLNWVSKLPRTAQQSHAKHQATRPRDPQRLILTCLYRAEEKINMGNISQLRSLHSPIDEELNYNPKAIFSIQKSPGSKITQPLVSYKRTAWTQVFGVKHGTQWEVGVGIGKSPRVVPFLLMMNINLDWDQVKSIFSHRLSPIRVGLD